MGQILLQIHVNKLSLILLFGQSVVVLLFLEETPVVVVCVCGVWAAGFPDY